jgi:hypothetical protein
MGSAISTTAGQDTIWDIVAAAIVLIFTELINQLVYIRRSRQAATSAPVKRSLSIDVLNLFKVGLSYNLFLEAFKLGS